MSKDGSRKKHFRTILFVALVLLALAVCWVIYWAAIAPIVSLYLIPHKGVYEDLSLYTEGTYKHFENSDVFECYMKTFEFPEEAELVAFYYIDNSTLDNPIYGKGSDVFSVDHRLPQTVYEDYSTTLSAQGSYLCNRQGFELYWFNVPLGDNYAAIVAFNDKEMVVRCCLVTSLGRQSTREEKEEKVKGQLFYRTSLDWGKWEEE